MNIYADKSKVLISNIISKCISVFQSFKLQIIVIGPRIAINVLIQYLFISIFNDIF